MAADCFALGLMDCHSRLDRVGLEPRVDLRLVAESTWVVEGIINWFKITGRLSCFPPSNVCNYYYEADTPLGAWARLQRRHFKAVHRAYKYVNARDQTCTTLWTTTTTEWRSSSSQTLLVAPKRVLDLSSWLAVLLHVCFWSRLVGRNYCH